MTKRAAYLLVVLFWLVFFLSYSNCSKAEEIVVNGHPMGYNNLDGGRIKGNDYLPYYPTAASIWARTIQIPCKVENGVTVCEGYSWKPEYGRAEYLFVEPVVVEEKQPDCPAQIIVQEPHETIVEHLVEKEVVAKPVHKKKVFLKKKSFACK